MEAGQVASTPTPPGGGLFGHLAPMRKDPLGFLLDTMRNQGDVVRLRFVHQKAYFLFHPDHVRHVLQDNYQNYTKQTFAYARIRAIFGESLTTSDGDFWLRQRRLSQPGFHRDRVAEYVPDMVQAARHLAERWSVHAARGETIDVASDMMHLSLSIVARTLLGTDPKEDQEELAVAVRQVLAITADRIKRIVSMSFLPTPENLRFTRAMAKIDRIAFAAIARRRALGGTGRDLLGSLVSARDEESGETMSDAQIRNEFLTLLIAGYETTSNALTWTWYCLSKYPPVERLLAEELAAVLPDRDPGLDDLPRLPVTRAVLHESMRLYPPTWIMNRAAVGEDRIGGHVIPSGSMIFMAPYATHRHPEFWKDPEIFDITRFEEGNEKQRHRFAFVPFGGGPHVCIGKLFALTEAQIVIATLARRFRLELAESGPIVFDANISLRPSSGMRMSLLPRSA
jgi:cytochrome P450